MPETITQEQLYFDRLVFHLKLSLFKLVESKTINGSVMDIWEMKQSLSGRHVKSATIFLIRDLLSISSYTEFQSHPIDGYDNAYYCLRYMNQMQDREVRR